MKPTRNKLPRKTPSKQKVSDNAKDAVKVFCRIRPMQSENEVSCMRLISPTTVAVSPPETAVNFKNNNYKEVHYTFKQVFGDNATQKEVFDVVALPLVEGLLQGKNGLLFTYGVTGSGKTYTMTGEPRDGGIMPRCLDVIFNTIEKYQAHKFIFKPDRMNGFDVQCTADAMLERQREIHSDIVQSRAPKTPRRKNSDEDLSGRICDPTSISCIEEDNTYSVFVSYLEIYNNNVYDLLEDSTDDPIRRALQSKIIREDATHNMYAHMITELEVKSSLDAFQAFYKGQKRKRMAHTSLNAESSRSHSVFTIRLVQAPLDAHGEEPVQNKNAIHISQLSLVDLAGSERTNRTKNTGQRLREAGNINTSLMTLRVCMEILRENQQNGSNKMVPYRDSKLTLLFKNYFEGEGKVGMIVCVNPRVDDFDETVHVMKFAEMTQEVQVTQPAPIKPIADLLSGRRAVNEAFKEAFQQVGVGGNVHTDFLTDLPFHRLSPQFPCLELSDPSNERCLKDLILFLETRIAKRNMLNEGLRKMQNEFRNQLIAVEKTNVLLTQENSSLQLLVDNERKKNVTLENKLIDNESYIAHLQAQILEKEKLIRSKDKEIHDMSCKLKHLTTEKENVKQHFSEKMVAEKEKMTREMQQKLREKNAQMKNQMREESEKLKKVRRIVTQDNTPKTPCVISSWPSHVKSETNLPSVSSNSDRNVVPSQFLTPDVRKHGFMTTSRRRRSRSVGNEVWIDHRPGIPTELDTVLQPNIKRRKSVTKLTDAKDVTNSKASKYMLMTQDLDSAGETETHIYKADVVPTTCGGAQVIFNDVETLTVRSPTSPSRKRSATLPNIDTEERCAVALEGHRKRPKI